MTMREIREGLGHVRPGQPDVIVSISRYTISVLPSNDINHKYFSLYVELKPSGWILHSGHEYYATDGTWQPSESLAQRSADASRDLLQEQVADVVVGPEPQTLASRDGRILYVTVATPLMMSPWNKVETGPLPVERMDTLWLVPGLLLVNAMVKGVSAGAARQSVSYLTVCAGPAPSASISSSVPDGWHPGSGGGLGDAVGQRRHSRMRSLRTMCGSSASMSEVSARPAWMPISASL
jgi:hypothetical protein